MTMEERMQLVFDHATADLARNYHAEPPDGQNMHPYEYEDQLAEWEKLRELADQNTVPLDLPRWLGRSPTPSESSMFSRCYRAGERRGYWERIKSGKRTLGLRLLATEAVA